MPGRFFLALGLMYAVTATAATCPLAPDGQWADAVLEWSSEYGDGDFGSKQVLGACDTESYGDHPTAWAAKDPDNGWEYVSVSFPNPVHATGVILRESFGNGFVFRVETIDVAKGYTIVWEGHDDSPRDEIAHLALSWPVTQELVRGLRVSIDGNRFQGWEELDSIQLLGLPRLPVVAVPWLPF